MQLDGLPETWTLGVMSPSLEEAIVEVAEGENNITESPLDFTSQTPVKPEVEVEYTVFIPEEEVENKTNEITSGKNTSKKKQKKLFDEEVEIGKIRNQNTQHIYAYTCTPTHTHTKAHAHVHLCT